MAPTAARDAVAWGGTGGAVTLAVSHTDIRTSCVDQQAGGRRPVAGQHPNLVRPLPRWANRTANAHRRTAEG